jgi:hypothetical protein
MCKFLSGIITKNKTIYDLDKDSHEDLIIKAGLKDTSRNPNFVRVELVPIDGDVFNHNPKNWKLEVDQDFRPEWFSKDFADAEMRKALADVINQRFIINDKSLQKRTGQRIYTKNSSVEAWGNSSVVAWGNSSVVARGNSSVEAWENSSVEAWGNSSVEAWGNSSVVAWENSLVVIPCSTDIKIKGIYDNASIKDLSGKPIIYVANKDMKLKVWRKK